MATQKTMPNPRVGIAVVVVDVQGRLLVGRRKGSHGSGTVQLPGGHLEYGEEFTTCAARETLEETGLEVKPVKVVAVTNDIFDKEQKHYITLFVYCEMVDPSAVPEVKEPEKCEGWSWMSWDDLKTLKGDSQVGEIIFRPLHNLLDERPNFNDLRPGSSA